jgi:hypothetical protein
VHDSATPEGAEMYEVSMSEGDNPYMLIDYPLWDGITFVDTLFVQRWNASLMQSSSASSETAYSLTNEDILMLTYCPAPFNGGMKPAIVLTINGLYYPQFQFEFDGECWWVYGVAINILSDGFTPLSDTGSPVCDAEESSVMVDESEASSFFGEYYAQNT